MIRHSQVLLKYRSKYPLDCMLLFRFYLDFTSEWIARKRLVES